MYDQDFTWCHICKLQPVKIDMYRKEDEIKEVSDDNTFVFKYMYMIDRYVDQPNVTYLQSFTEIIETNAKNGVVLEATSN